MTNKELLRIGLLATVSLTLLGGCGFKNQPVSPQAVVPKAVTDLGYTMSDKGVRLTWSFPVETIRGTTIDDISTFMLYRAEIPLEEYCGNCPIPFSEPQEVEAGPTLDGTTRRQAAFDADMLLSGYKYFYKVQSRTSWWAASDDSNIISFVWLQPAAAPQGVTATPADHQIALKWQPVTTLSDGKPVTSEIQYQVFRSTGGKEFAKVGSPIVETGWTDKQVRNGIKYFYRVQTMMAAAGEVAGGGVSADVSASAIDLTPPPPVSGVMAVATGQGIKVFWEKSEAADLAGYRVYRRAFDSDTYKRIGDLKPEYTLFVDREAGDSVRYYYAVTAIDAASPPNESIKSKESTIRH